MQLFDPSETTNDLDALLKEAGFDPEDKTIDGVKQVISRYYAKRTAEILERVQEVLANFTAMTARRRAGRGNLRLKANGRPPKGGRSLATYQRKQRRI